jgi:hypothetical protein
MNESYVELERQRRVELQEREIQILTNAAPDPELDAWINWRAAHPVALPDLD